ncbi:MAG: RNA-binding protein, partial [Clostridia bacterium]|nr:RNA-binding protein [Clostridia bacterium]
MDIIEALAKELNISRDRVERTVALIDEGNTIPFIARYRKEVTGSLDDTVLRTLDE